VDPGLLRCDSLLLGYFLCFEEMSGDAASHLRRYGSSIIGTKTYGPCDIVHSHNIPDSSFVIYRKEYGFLQY
jgi:hypothetical protein